MIVGHVFFCGNGEKKTSGFGSVAILIFWPFESVVVFAMGAVAVAGADLAKSMRLLGGFSGTCFEGCVVVAEGS